MYSELPNQPGDSLLGAFWFRRFGLEEIEHAEIRAELDRRATVGA